MQIYNDLKDAVNCKIIFLTGTPMINYPNELGILFNMLRGNIKVLNFSVSSGDATNIHKIIKKIKTIDYIEYDENTRNLKITLNPFGFINFNTPKSGVIEETKMYTHDKYSDESTTVKNLLKN